MKIDFVLFDLDGVLIDACEWHYEALNTSLKKITGMSIAREDHISLYNGLPTRVKLRMLGIDEKVSEEVERTKQEETIRLIEKNCKIDDVKIELLEHLKAKGCKIACVTNSIKNSAELMLKLTGQLNYMDLVVSNEDVKNNKPSPDCYNLAIEKLSAFPDSTLCVEDSPKGIQSAKASLAKNLWQVENSFQVTLENYKRAWS